MSMYLDNISYVRLEACAKACQGIPTQALEAGAVRELVEAAKGILGLAENFLDLHMMQNPENDLDIKKCRAALSKFTSGKGK